MFNSTKGGSYKDLGDKTGKLYTESKQISEETPESVQKAADEKFEKVGQAIQQTKSDTENFIPTNVREVSNLMDAEAYNAGEVYEEGVDRAVAAMEATKDAIDILLM